jgi:16S rRNA (cytidine1402-2'-O)-methyltransferase
MSIKDHTALYVVPTPIGNLQDMTPRAIKVLSEVDTILSEDTRTTGKLLKHFGISTKQKSYHIHNEHKQVEFLVERMQAGDRFALVSDAGTPGISDPGFLLVRATKAAECKVECLPGATAFVPALINSGFPADRFVFEGFLPHKKGRQTRLKLLAEEERTVILYESPHRLKKALNEIVEYFGENRMVSVSREISKMYEETQTSQAHLVRNYFEEKEIKGEIVIVIRAHDKNELQQQTKI